MGLFGNDKEQDARLEAIEYHVRLVSDALQQGQLDIAALTVKVIGLQSQLGDKLSEEDFDPSVIALNEQLAAARIEIGKVSSAATESWSSLHSGASDALSTLRTAVESASAEVEKKQSD
jgi:hypothetical protein